MTFLYRSGHHHKYILGSGLFPDPATNKNQNLDSNSKSKAAEMSAGQLMSDSNLLSLLPSLLSVSSLWCMVYLKGAKEVVLKHYNVCMNYPWVKSLIYVSHKDHPFHSEYNNTAPLRVHYIIFKWLSITLQVENLNQSEYSVAVSLVFRIRLICE